MNNKSIDTEFLEYFLENKFNLMILEIKIKCIGNQGHLLAIFDLLIWAFIYFIKPDDYFYIY